MDDDLLEQLRTRHIKLGYELPTESLFSAAADEIERLNAENARLREERPQIDYVIDSHGVTHRSFTLVYKTRAALAEKENNS